jgi:hypothetical protein
MRGVRSGEDEGGWAAVDVTMMDPKVEERLLSRWVVSGLFSVARPSGEGSALDRAFECMPRKTAANKGRAVRWAVRKMGEVSEIDDLLHSFLRWLIRPVAAGLAAEEWRGVPDAGSRAHRMLQMRCAALRFGKVKEFDAALEDMPESDRARYAQGRADALRWAGEWEEGERARRADARAQSSGLQAARDEAARQAQRADRAAREAAERVAAAERDRRRQADELQRSREEVRLLRDLLTERDAEIAHIVQEYERRISDLGRGEAEPAPLPLEGMSVVIVADPNRAVAYRAEATALGASGVEFIDGMVHPGAHLRHLIEGADCVVVCLAWTKHSTSGIVRRHARGRICEMTIAGLRAFRDAVAAGGQRDQLAAASAGAMPAHTRTLRVVGASSRPR